MMSQASDGPVGAVEAGGTKFVAALASGAGDILARARIATSDPGTTFRAMADFFRQSSAGHGAIRGFGIASFGPIDVDPASAAYGTITTTPKPGWSGARYHDALREFGAPLLVDSDVNGAALGEWKAGAGRGCGTVAYTTVGTGVGTGVVHHGQALAGISHFESGHIRPPRDPADDFAGVCPFHGACLEGLASGPAIERRWGGSLDRLDPGCDATPLIGGYIAHLAATLVLLHMPDRLIFGGGVMKTPGLIETVRERTAILLSGYVRHAALDPGLEGYIAAPALGDDAGITGAIELALRAGTPRP